MHMFRHADEVAQCLKTRFPCKSICYWPQGHVLCVSSMTSACVLSSPAALFMRLCSITTTELCLNCLSVFVMMSSALQHLLCCKVCHLLQRYISRRARRLVPYIALLGVLCVCGVVVGPSLCLSTLFVCAEGCVQLVGDDRWTACCVY
jgi:hypothetical protein